jgi:hypothetical protein
MDARWRHRDAAVMAVLAADAAEAEKQRQEVRVRGGIFAFQSKMRCWFLPVTPHVPSPPPWTLLASVLP